MCAALMFILLRIVYFQCQTHMRNKLLVSTGPGGPAIVNTMVKADGKLDCDINSYGKHNGSFFHTDALQSSKADVATLIFWNFEIPEAIAKGMTNAAFFSLKEWGVPDFCQLVLMTTPEHFKKRKQIYLSLIWQ